MTHPDDEISICAWIKRLTTAGAEVFVNWTHSTPVRQAEARSVAAKLDVKSERLSFMDGKDGHICDQLSHLLPQFKALMNSTRPDRVVCGAFEQGHLDHDATNWLVNHTFRGPIFEVPFYHPYTKRLQTMNRFATAEAHESILLTPGEQRLKVQIAKSFKSQNIWTVLWWYEVYQGARLNRMELRKREFMRLQVHLDFSIPNLPPRLRARVDRSPQWSRWLRAIEEANMPP
jgi:hypothetical protein